MATSASKISGQSSGFPSPKSMSSVRQKQYDDLKKLVDGLTASSSRQEIEDVLTQLEAATPSNSSIKRSPAKNGGDQEFFKEVSELCNKCYTLLDSVGVDDGDANSSSHSDASDEEKISLSAASIKINRAAGEKSARNHSRFELLRTHSQIAFEKKQVSITSLRVQTQPNEITTSQGDTNMANAASPASPTIKNLAYYQSQVQKLSDKVNRLGTSPSTAEIEKVRTSIQSTLAKLTIHLKGTPQKVEKYKNEFAVLSELLNRIASPEDVMSSSNIFSSAPSTPVHTVQPGDSPILDGLVAGGLRQKLDAAFAGASSTSSASAATASDPDSTTGTAPEQAGQQTPERTPTPTPGTTDLNAVASALNLEVTPDAGSVDANAGTSASTVEMTPDASEPVDATATSASATTAEPETPAAAAAPASVQTVEHIEPLPPVTPVAPVVTEQVKTAVKIEAVVALKYGENLFVRGTGDELAWGKGVKMEWSSGNVWVASLAGRVTEVKFLLNDKEWEEKDGNHVVTGDSLRADVKFKAPAQAPAKK